MDITQKQIDVLRKFLTGAFSDGLLMGHGRNVTGWNSKAKTYTEKILPDLLAALSPDGLTVFNPELRAKANASIFGTHITEVLKTWNIF